MITFLGGVDATEISEGMYEVNTAMTGGVTIWITYAKGDENFLGVYFGAYKDGVWYTVTDIDATTFEAYNRLCKFTTDGSYCLTIPQPSNAEKTLVVFSYSGGSTFGDSSIYLTPDSRYSS
jgi:hypothetical protein